MPPWTCETCGHLRTNHRLSGGCFVVCCCCCEGDGDSEMTKTEKNVNEIVEMVQEAIDRAREADDAIVARDAALDRLKAKVGGDRISAIRNGQLRIGKLMTRKASSDA